jgi:diaminopropionate ammonia-lyase
VFVPSFVAPPRIAAIRAEGARVEVVNGIFEDALHAAVAAASERCVLLSDDSWPGYTEVPGWVIDGYSTMFWEIDDQLAAAGRPGPEVVLVQMGVGALAAATVRHYRRAEARRPPTIIGVEPLSAACVQESLVAGEPGEVPGPSRQWGEGPPALMRRVACGPTQPHCPIERQTRLVGGAAAGLACSRCKSTFGRRRPALSA